MFRNNRKIMSSYFCSVFGLIISAIGQLFLLLIERPRPPSDGMGGERVYIKYVPWYRKIYYKWLRDYRIGFVLTALGFILQLIGLVLMHP